MSRYCKDRVSDLPQKNIARDTQLFYFGFEKSTVGAASELAGAS